MKDLVAEIRSALAGRFTIDREIGRGGMAYVFRGHDLKLRRDVAIKVLRPGLAASLGPERFLREIEIEAGLTHPHILPLYDSGAAAGTLYYVMPYVEGESLRDRLEREGQLPFAAAARIARQVCSALAYAHARGIVHRDIKPENILLASDQALVADFGIARAISEAGGQTLTGTGIAIGTPPYMSPEQAAGESAIDGRSDIYSLGCVLFEMLAGEPPFTGRTPQAVIAQHMLERIPSLEIQRPDLPPGVTAVVKRALAKSPADRFGTAEDLALALESVERAGGSSARPGKSRRVGALVAVIALAALAIWLALESPWERVASSTEPTASELGTAPARPLRTRIAIIPFDDGSRDGSLSDLAMGLTRDLIDRLNLVDVLDVISARALEPYIGPGLTPDSIARLFKAGTLVYGTVQPIGDSIRASVWLVDPTSGVQEDQFHVVGQRREPLSLQEEIAERLAHDLRQRIGKEITLSEQRDATDSDEAWSLYQAGQRLGEDAKRLMAAESFAEAATWLDQADSAYAGAEKLDADWLAPTLARGWLSLDRANWVYYANDLSMAEPSPAAAERLRSGIAHAERALRRWPRDGRALTLRGSLAFHLAIFGDRARADSLLDAAIADLTAAARQDPTWARAWYTLSEVYALRGEADLAAFAAERARAADVYVLESQRVLESLFFDALYREAYGEAERWCDSGRLHYPDNRNFLECEFRLLALTGGSAQDAQRAWHMAARLDSIPRLSDGLPYRRFFVAAILARAGLADSARAVIARARDEAPAAMQEELYPVEAYVRTLLGEHARALDLIEHALARESLRKSFVAQHPWYKGLRDDPRFQELVGTP